MKASNKLTQKGALNGSYNIFPEKVRRAAERHGAVPAWVTLQVDADRACYSAYFGRIEDLRNPNAVGVLMTLSAVEDYECPAYACPVGRAAIRV